MSGRNRFKIIGMLVAIALCFSLPALSQDDVETVRDSAFTKHRRPPAVFLHDDHNEAAGIDDCSVCHHVWEAGKKLEDETSEDRECSECHLTADARDTMPLVRIYHSQCKSCHLTQRKGPVMCGECHRRVD